MRKYYPMILAGVVSILIIPSIALAAWWNPFTWFQKKPVEQPVVQVIAPTAPVEKKPEVKQVKKKTTTPTMQNNSVLDIQNTSQEANVANTQKTSCRTENNAPLPPEYSTGGEIRDYFNKLIYANPSISNLNQIKSTLISYRDDPDPYKMGVKSGIPFTAQQLDDIENSFSPIIESRIRYYSGLIAVIDLIIRDKQDGCVNAMTLADYSTQ